MAEKITLIEKECDAELDVKSKLNENIEQLTESLKNAEEEKDEVEFHLNSSIKAPLYIKLIATTWFWQKCNFEEIIFQIASELQELHGKYTQSQQDRDKLKLDLAASNQQIEQLSSKMDEQAGSLQDKLTASEKELTAVQAKLTNSEEQLTASQQELTAMKTDLVKTQEQLTATKQEMTAAVEAKVVSSNNLQEQLTASQQELTAAQEKLASSDGTIAGLKDEVSSLNGQLTAYAEKLRLTRDMETTLTDKVRIAPIYWTVCEKL